MRGKTDVSLVEEMARRVVDEGIPYNKIAKALKIDDLDTVVDVRLRALELKTGADLSHIGGRPVSFADMRDDHEVPDENFIGTIQVPVGVVGPVKIKRSGHLGREEVTYLLASTERSLLAGANAAAKIINASGGVEAIAYPETNLLARSSSFTIDDFFRLPEYKREIAARTDELQRIIREGYGRFKGSQHARLAAVDVFSEDDFLWIRYNIDPGDAAGHNIVTNAAFMMNNYLSKELGEMGLPLKPVILSGGICKDKNAAAINYDRGIKAQARVLIPYKVCEEFEIDPEVTATAAFSKNYLAQSIAGGMRGNNSSVANPFTALAVVYGQDVANVIEASQARTVIRQKDEGLSYSLNTGIVCGTIGGGTIWPCQQEALKLLGLYGADPAQPGHYKAAFAEVIASALLLSEVAVFRSLTTGEEGRGERHFKSHNGRFRKPDGSA